MSSARLPGKSLLPLAGKPALRYVLDRLERAHGLDLVVVATSEDATDDVIADFCRTSGIDCHRGPLEDVARRFADVIDRYGLDAFVRVSGDSPLLDQALVTRAVAMFTGEPTVDMVTNIAAPRTFPHGESVEVVRADAFRSALAEMAEPDDREHVTPYLYRQDDRFVIRCFSAPEDFSDVRLALDTDEDADRIRGLLDRQERPHWEYGYEELVRLVREPA
jgi:spore coat polysaccharide biosynthesis protein SpsF